MINRFKRLYRIIEAIILAQKWAWKNAEKSLPIYAKLGVQGLRVHLGSGPINMQGWVNVDARAYDHVHVVSDGFDLHEFSDGSISEIYLCHVLEHFSFIEAEKLLISLRLKIRPGGIIRISVPCFDKLVKIYEESDRNINNIKYALMGGQEYKYNFHKSLYTSLFLKNLLMQCGFREIKEWDDITDFGVKIGDWSSGTFDTKSGPLPISLNLKGIK
jgi:predicted SAM-dependent methyltransferase